MSRNGSGTYTLPSAAFVAGTTIDPTPMNSNFSDIAAQITNSVAADGQTTMTGALKMGGQNISNAGTVGVGGALNVTGSAAVGGALTVTGTTALNSTLNVALGATGVKGWTASGYDSGNLNFRATAANYGVGFRNDDAYFYLMMTNSGSPTATYNALRPFTVTLATGAVAMGGAVSVAGAVSAASMSAPGLINGGTLSTVGQVVCATMAASGAVTTGAITSSSTLQATGYRTRSGTAGSYGANYYNLYWDTSFVSVYVDSVFIGAIQFVSDRRVKQDITDAPGGALDRVMQWRVVEYDFADVGVWKPTGQRQLGFIADELQAVSPATVIGAPDAVGPDGSIRPQSPNILAMLAEITAALQSVVRRVEALEHTSR